MGGGEDVIDLSEEESSSPPKRNPPETTINLIDDEEETTPTRVVSTPTSAQESRIGKKRQRTLVNEEEPDSDDTVRGLPTNLSDSSTDQKPLVLGTGGLGVKSLVGAQRGLHNEASQDAKRQRMGSTPSTPSAMILQRPTVPKIEGKGAASREGTQKQSISSKGFASPQVKPSPSPSPFPFSVNYSPASSTPASSSSTNDTTKSTNRPKLEPSTPAAPSPSPQVSSLYRDREDSSFDSSYSEDDDTEDSRQLIDRIVDRVLSEAPSNPIARSNIQRELSMLIEHDYYSNASSTPDIANYALSAVREQKLLKRLREVDMAATECLRAELETTRKVLDFLANQHREKIKTLEKGYLEKQSKVGSYIGSQLPELPTTVSAGKPYDSKCWLGKEGDGEVVAAVFDRIRGEWGKLKKEWDQVSEEKQKERKMEKFLNLHTNLFQALRDAFPRTTTSTSTPTHLKIEPSYPSSSPSSSSSSSASPFVDH